MDVVALELFKGFGRFWLHPLTYIFFLTALWFGMRRVKRERKDFHTRVYDVIHEITFPLLSGMIVGLILSVIFSVVGIEIPSGMLALLCIIWILLLPFNNMRFLSMTTVASLAFVITLFLPEGGTGYPLIDEWLASISTMNTVGFAWIIAGLFLAEAILVFVNGWKETSPKLIPSERGKTIGTHELRRLWLLPVLLLIPVGNVSFDGFWPLFSSGGVSNGFMFVPFIVGTQLSVRSEFPEIGVKRIAKQFLIVSLAVVLFAGFATVWPFLAPIVGIIGVVVREIVFAIHASNEKHSTSIYTKQEEGMTVLGVLPYSTAEKMGIRVGEIILKVNGTEVSSQSELYEALQINPAFCKLDVINRDGQVHFVQSSIFEGDHHQIGLLFVPDGDMNLSAKGLRYSTIINRDRDVIRKSYEMESKKEEKEASTTEAEDVVKEANFPPSTEAENTEESKSTTNLDTVNETEKEELLQVAIEDEMDGTEDEQTGGGMAKSEELENIIQQLEQWDAENLTPESEQRQSSIQEDFQLDREEKDSNGKLIDHDSIKDEEDSSSTVEHTMETNDENEETDLKDITEGELDDSFSDESLVDKKEIDFEEKNKKEVENEISDTTAQIETVEVELKDDSVPLIEENFKRELQEIEEMRERDKRERRAELGDRPYGQAAGLEAFYADFRKVSKDKDLWKELLDDEPTNQPDPEEQKKKEKE